MENFCWINLNNMNDDPCSICFVHAGALGEYNDNNEKVLWNIKSDTGEKITKEIKRISVPPLYSTVENILKTILSKDCNDNIYVIGKENDKQYYEDLLNVYAVKWNIVNPIEVKLKSFNELSPEKSGNTQIDYIVVNKNEIGRISNEFFKILKFGKI